MLFMQSILRKLLILLPILLFILSADANAAGKTLDGERPENAVLLNFMGCTIVLNTDTNTVVAKLGGQYEVSENDEWTVLKPAPGIYHLRHAGFKKNFLEIDTEKAISSYVIEGEFGKLTNARKTTFPSTMNFIPSATNPKHEIIIQQQMPMSMIVDGEEYFDGPITFYSEREDWEVKKLDELRLHVRHKQWKDFFFEYDDSLQGIYVVKGGRFGVANKGTRERVIHASVNHPFNPMRNQRPMPVPGQNKTQPRMVMPPVPGSGDIEMTRYFGGKDPAPSKWLEDEKMAYADLLATNTYDVVVAPLQVDAYAFDLPNRMMITRRIASRIAKSDKWLKVADPTITALALGPMDRTHDQFEIYNLAGRVGAKYIVVPYGGHAKNEMMHITVKLLSAGDKGGFAQKTTITEKTWTGIPFTDERSPAEAFLGIADEVFEWLSFDGKGESVAVKYSIRDELELPESPMSLVTDKPRTSVHAAYYLQLLGVLYPNDHFVSSTDLPRRNHLFERSIIALEGVSERSADYPLLKSRAMLYLYSRPAALAALGKPRKPEERAFKAYLDGDLYELERWSKKIRSPLKRLMAEIELFDLRSSYGRGDEPGTQEMLESVGDKYKGWEALIVRRYIGRDGWFTWPNIAVKALLDESFPIEGLGAEELLNGALIAGGPEGLAEEAAFMVLKHYRKALEVKPVELLSTDASDRPMGLDYLRLLHDTSTMSIKQALIMTGFTQGLSEEALQGTDFMLRKYSGHPEMTTLKVEWMSRLKNQNLSAGEGITDEEILNLKAKVCYWSQGQNLEAERTCVSQSRLAYTADYPTRWYYRISGLGDRNQFNGKSGDPYLGWERSFMYTHDSVDFWKGYYEDLVTRNRVEEAESVYERNLHRFNGSTKKDLFVASYIESKKGHDKSIDYLRSAIEKNRYSFSLYEPVIRDHIKRGEFKEAVRLTKSFPYFNEETKGGNRVGNSNDASNIGLRLYSKGAVEEAREIFELATAFNSNSSYELTAAEYLHISKGELGEAARIALTNAKRYNDPTDYDHFQLYMHAMGYHEEAWSALNAMGEKALGKGYGAVAGHRIEGKSNEEITRWLFERFGSRMANIDGFEFLFRLHMADRAPDERFAERMAEAGRLAKQAPKRQHTPEVNLVEKRYVPIARGYTSLRQGNLKSAWVAFDSISETKGFESLTDRNAYYANNDLFGMYLPYYAWAGVKTGNGEKAGEFIELVKDRFGDTFQYRLARGMLYGARGEHEKAIAELKHANTRMPCLLGCNSDLWYQMVEAAEIIYADSGNKKCRDMALEWAKNYQVLVPTGSWAYAVEAKYTDSPEDRRRALGIAMFLDRQSERISGFSEAERTEALKWFGENDPFVKDAPIELAGGV